MYLKSLAISLINNCNLRCEYCDNLSRYYQKNYHTINDYIYNINTLLKNNIEIRALVLTGGEPFLHSNLENEIYNIRDKLYNKNQYIVLISNGFWIKNQNYQQYNNIFKNINELQISLYSKLYPDLEKDKDILNFKNYINDNFKNILLILNNREYFYPWNFIEYEENKLNFSHICDLFTCYTLKNSRIYLCSLMPVSDILKETKAKLFYKYLQEDLDLISFKIEDNFNFDKLHSFLNIDIEKISCCKYCTHSIYNNFYKKISFIQNNFKNNFKKEQILRFFKIKNINL
jgi:organic radical activating enzyme